MLKLLANHYPWNELWAPVNIPNWFLAFIGLAGVIAALMTLGAIRRQIRVQEENLRPRLTIGFIKQPSSFTPYSEMISGKNPILRLELINTGGIPAYGVIPETWLEYLHRPFEFTAAAIYHKGGPLTIHPTESSFYLVPFGRTLTQCEIAACRSAEATICLRIKLSYSAFGKEVHTQGAFCVTPNSMDVLTEYSEAT